MELKTLVFNAVSDGNLTRLKDLFQFQSKDDIKDIVSTKVDGTTLLLLAARNGYYYIMEYLVNHCGADIEQVGKVEFDGEIIDDAPPLWCAAAAGYFFCVKLLLNKGAKVNSTTRTNSTPLRAACFDGHFEIVKLLIKNGADIEIANKHGHTCLMISCYKRHLEIASCLIDRGAQVNRQSIKGNTALHDCAESNSMEIMKLLVRHGAVFKQDCFGLTPLMTAAMTGNVEMVDYLKSTFVCSVDEEVDSYKLLGATHVDKFYDLSGAFDYWRNALKKMSNCSQEYIDKLNNSNEYYLEAYGKTNEYRTEEDLNNLYCDPDLMKMQSLIIRERILGIHHPETFYFIRYRGAAYADSGDYSRCLSLWLYNLERQKGACKPLSDITQNSFISMIELFSLMLSKCDSSIRICDIFRVLKLAITELLDSCNISMGNNEDVKLYQILERKIYQHKDKRMFKGDINGLDRHFLIVIQLIGLMHQLRPKMTSKEWKDFRKSIYEFISLEPRSTCSYTLLHILCIISHNELIPSINIPLFDVFTLVVDVSRNLNIIDLYGNTPLHFLFDQQKIKTNMISYLIKSGAHLDLSNEEGFTPLDYVTNRTIKNFYQIKFLSLKCLCAQFIAKNDIPSDFVSEDLQSLIDSHRNKGQSHNIFYN